MEQDVQERWVMPDDKTLEQVFRDAIQLILRGLQAGGAPSAGRTDARLA